MSSTANNAASITPPVGGTDPNTITLNTSATKQSFVVPKTWLRGYITVAPDAEDVFVSFTGAEADTIDPTAVSTIGAGGVVTTVAGQCMRVPAGGERPYDLCALNSTQTSARDEVFCHVISAAANGVVRFHRSSGKWKTRGQLSPV